MTFRDETRDMKLKIKAEGFDLTPVQRRAIEADAETLRKATERFPIADLTVHAHHHPRRADYHVTANLRLPKRILFTGERDARLDHASQRCCRKLLEKVRRYKEDRDQRPAMSKAARGTRHAVDPDSEPDAGALTRAAEERDFTAFRESVQPWDGDLERAVGRWIERYPDAAAVLGRRVVVSQFVDEVYLNAFERFDSRPKKARLGEWLETLIDPSIRAILDDPEGELRNLSFLSEAEEGSTGS